MRPSFTGFATSRAGRSCSRSFATGDSQQFLASLTDLQLAYTHLVVVGQRLMDILKAGEDWQPSFPRPTLVRDQAECAEDPGLIATLTCR